MAQKKEVYRVQPLTEGKKNIISALKTIYLAPSEEAGRTALDEVFKKWDKSYPYAMKRWYDNRDAYFQS